MKEKIYNVRQERKMERRKMEQIYNTDKKKYGCHVGFLKKIGTIDIKGEEPIYKVERFKNSLYLQKCIVLFNDYDTCSLHREGEPILIVELGSDDTLSFNQEALDLLKNHVNQILNLEEIGLAIMELVQQNEKLEKYFLNISGGLSRKEVINTFYSIMINGLSFLEKILSGYGETFFKSNVLERIYIFDVEKNKLKQAVGIPTVTINFIKQNYAELYGDFKQLCEKRSPNDAVVLTEFIIDLEKMIRKNGEYRRSHIVKNFIIKVISIALLCDTSMKTLINYLYTQSFTYREDFSVIDFPVSVAITMLDYIEISIKNNLPFERLPSNIDAAHYYLLENVKYAENKEKQEEFERVVKNYKNLESYDKEYCVLTPNTVVDMIKEGNDLKHCIANYVDNVIKGSKVLFCRKSDETEKSFVSFEVDNDLNFVQIKEKFDVDVTDENVLTYLMNWQATKKAEIFEQVNGEKEVKHKKIRKNVKQDKEQLVLF